MPSSNRGNEPATLGIFGAISALVLCCFIVGILAYSSGQETERRDKTPAAYSEAAKSKAQEDCAGREGNAAFECIYEKVEASQQQAHDEQDLTAQQKSANGTMITAALAFLGLIASVVGIGLVYTTFHETRKANKISEQTVRPWLVFDEPDDMQFTWYTADLGHPCLSFWPKIWVKNVGQTPARNVVVMAKLMPLTPEAHTTWNEEITQIVTLVRTTDHGTNIPPGQRYMRQHSELRAVEEYMNVPYTPATDELAHGLMMKFMLAAIYLSTDNEPHIIQESWEIGVKRKLGRRTMLVQPFTHDVVSNTEIEVGIMKRYTGQLT